MTLVKLIEESKRHKKRTSLIFEGKKISYADLSEKVRRFGAGLQNLGLKRGEKVAILLKNCPEFIISYFGILRAGGIAVPLNTFLKTEELKLILQDSSARFLITSSQLLEKVRNLQIRLENLEKIISTDKIEEGTTSFSELKKDFPIVEPLIFSEDIAAILYTSGTTGQPKGVLLTHHNLISNILSSLKMIKVTSKDRFVCLLPMFHSFAFTVCVLLPLYLGSPIIIFSTLHPFSKILRKIITARVTIFVAIPPIYNLLTSQIKIPSFIPPFLIRLFLPVRLCISGAAPLSSEILKRFEKKFHLPLLEGYGLTETSPVVSLNPPKKRKSGSVGLPLPGISVRIINEKGEELPFGEIGELYIKGENVMKGYFNQPKETEKVLKNGWLATGDLARIDEEGYIYIVDRKKEMIIFRGLNIYPREVEDVLYTYPGIREVAVIGMKDEKHGELPIAFISLKEGMKVQPADILKYCRQRLATYKVPRRIILKDSLPKNPAGKILKRELIFNHEDTKEI